MDPLANIQEQLTLATDLALAAVPDEHDVRRLAELVSALDEWRRTDGFDPYGGDAQSNALARLMRLRPEQGVQVTRNPFDLPSGYWLVTFTPSGFICGISPEGHVSS